MKGHVSMFMLVPWRSVPHPSYPHVHSFANLNNMRFCFFYVVCGVHFECLAVSFLIIDLWVSGSWSRKKKAGKGTEVNFLTEVKRTQDGPSFTDENKNWGAANYSGASCSPFPSLFSFLVRKLSVLSGCSIWQQDHITILKDDSKIRYIIFITGWK